MARTGELDPCRRVDHGAEGAIVGVEVPTVGRGVEVRGLPEGELLGRLFEDGGIRQLG